MRRFSSSLVAILALATLGFAAGNGLAACNGGNKGGGFGGGYGGLGRGGISVGLGGPGGYNRQLNQPCNYSNNYGGAGQPYGDQAYEPFHSYYVCQPGDSFYTVSLKEYGTSAAAPYIARFNRLTQSAALTPGQPLMLPSVSRTGQLSQSRAPAPAMESAPQGPLAVAKFLPTTTAPAPSTAPTTSAPSLPSVPAGSVLALDGTEFGNDKGVIRLRVGSIAFPAEVLDWTSSSTKTRLPEVDLTEAVKAEIEVLRADGSVASKTAVNLTPATSGLAKN